MDKLPEDIDGEGGEDFRNWGQKRSKRPFLTKVRREIADIAIWDSVICGEFVNSRRNWMCKL
jgi:hypothetical protein